MANEATRVGSPVIRFELEKERGVIPGHREAILFEEIQPHDL
jgi:hypothetical protein